MRMAFWKHLIVLAVLGAGAGTGAIAPAVQAAQFEQQEVDQSRFIIVAAPGGELGYKLLIIEQIKDSRPCWSETGSNPSTVEPLLLSFDFTGICNRIVDSNGFSMRAAGEDQALNYSLRIIPQDNDLVLVAASNSRRNTWVEIGRTNGLPTGFSRINLNSGWRLTRRAFNGKAIGHVYITYDQPVDMLATNNLRRVSNVPAPGLSPDLPPDPIAPPTSPDLVPVPSLPPGSAAPVPSPLPAPPVNQLPSPTPNRAPNLSTLLPPPSPIPAPAAPAPAAPTQAATQASSVQTSTFQVIVEADSAEMQDKVRAVAPSALLTTINGQVVMQVGVFRDRQEADQLQQRLSQEGLPTAVIPVR